jgi:hypothetical protein
MKRILLALLIGGATLTSLSSCTKEYITEEVNVLDGFSYVYPVNSNQWTKNGNIYSIEIAVNNLDEQYYEDGHVSVAVNFVGSKTYELIPSEIFGHDYSSNYSIGKVRIFAKDVSGLTPKAPDNMDIKIVLTDAAIGN